MKTKIIDQFYQIKLKIMINSIDKIHINPILFRKSTSVADGNPFVKISAT